MPQKDIQFTNIYDTTRAYYFNLYIIILGYFIGKRICCIVGSSKSEAPQCSFF